MDIGDIYPFQTGPIAGAVPKFNATARTVMLCEVNGVASDPSNPAVDVHLNNAPSSNSGASAATTGTCDVPENGNNSLGNNQGEWFPAHPLNQYGTGAMATGPLANGGSWSGGYGNWAGLAGTALRGIHFSGSNYLLADGHVKWLMGKNVSSGWWAASPTTAQVNGPYSSTATRAEGTDVGIHTVTFSPI